ncbi:glycosyltransferase family 2 protein [Ilumatobacter sp.]|uniref:glycosyltransferase family 2 protein n=1 Tax=Ilumatobacter sp. TaxID=1967498 RepID=UPI003B52ECA0
MGSSRTGIVGGRAPRSIAVVMPAHRPGPDLAASVAAIGRLDPAPDEFVVVVDGGDEGVVEQVDGVATTVAVARAGPAAARNVGVRSTTSEVVLFVDSDVVVRPDIVAAVRDALDRTDADDLRPDAVVGSYDDRPAAGTTVSRFRNLLHHWTHQRAGGPAHTFWGACGAVRREAFDAVGGFDEAYRDATIEDIELGERLVRAGYRIEVVPSIQVTHLKRWTLANMVRTDVTKRGVPWTRLMLGQRSMSDDLNTTVAARVTVALTGVLAVAAAGSLVPAARRVAAPVAAVTGAVLVWRDREFLAFLRRRHSTAFAVRSVPLMWIHHASAGVAFAWAVATWPWFAGRSGTAAG